MMSLCVQIKSGDALVLMAEMSPSSVHVIVTDPPYFIDGMDAHWNEETLSRKALRAKVVKSLPVGMKFDSGQARAFGDFMHKVSKEVLRVLVPGGFFISFAQARLYHRLATAAEDAGFEIRDMIGWIHGGQAKAFSMDHFVRKMNIAETEKERLIQTMVGRKTPQLRPQIEPMILAQKPKEGTFVHNWSVHGTGLMDAHQKWEGKFPSNVIVCPKPSSKEKGEDNKHMTVKPLRLIEHLIRLFSAPGQIVLDPFMGSGTHGVAAIACGRNFIGFEKQKIYIDLAKKRIDKVLHSDRGLE